VSENDAQRRRQLFDEYRKQAWDDIRSGTDNFDKNLLTVSSSALALSLAFIKDFTPLPTAVSLPVLYTSWACFAGTIVTTIFSFRLSIAAVNKHLEYAYKYYEENDDKILGKKSAAERALSAFTWIAAILFLVGVFATVIFCVNNVRDKVKDNPKKTVNTVAREFAKDGRSPLSLTPVPKPETLEKGRKPAALTPVPGGTEERGRQPAAIIPVQPIQPEIQPSTTQSTGSATEASNTGTPATTDKK
jgi:preprotein translocase subunit SecG